MASYDVVSDFCQALTDGEPFWVERRVSRTRLLSLRYGVGDEERTMVGQCRLTLSNPR